MKEEEEGLQGQECGSKYARMDREGCANSTLDRNRLDGRVFTAIDFNIPQKILLTHNFHNERDLSFFGPFTEKNSSRIFHCSP